jgi:neutral ceramidase
MSDFLAGFAEVDYTPAPGLAVCGQHHTRIATRTRDPLMANAVAMRRGDSTVVIVSNDICLLLPDFVDSVQRSFAERTGLPAGRLLIHATHSHVAPNTIPNFWGEVDPGFMETFRESIVSAAATAVARLEPVTVFSGIGQLDNLNWNRMSMYDDGTSAMHGSADKPGFIGTEGTRDPNLGVIFCRNKDGRITGVIANFGTHPNCVENECYYSADIPGEVRRLVKAMLGSDTGVVYLTGAAGNVAPIIREPGRTMQPWMGEDGLHRSGLYLSGEISKIIAQAVEPIESPDLTVGHTDLHIPIRPYPAKDDNCYPNSWGGESETFYRQCEADWPRKMREESPVEIRVNVVRIGDTVICTNPGEIYSDFALQIRELSPARVTLISQLTDGFCGYIPTPAAFTRGGYTTWPCITSKLSPDAGGMIVEATKELLEL